MIFAVLFVGRGSTKRWIHSSEQMSTSGFSKSSSTSFEKRFTSNFNSNSMSACMKDFTGSKYTLKELVERFGQDDTFNQSLTDKERGNVEAEAAS